MLHLEKLWDRNITLTTRLVDTATTPMLLKILQAGKLAAKKMGTHSFALSDVMKATFIRVHLDTVLNKLGRRDARPTLPAVLPPT